LSDKLRIIDTGVFSIDGSGSGSAAQVDLFDDYDDAALIEKFARRDPSAMDLLMDLGVLEPKESGDGYMIRLQPALQLIAGGIYQSAERISKLEEEVRGLRALGQPA